MKLKILLLAIVGLASACTEYSEPTVNCFAFRAAAASVDNDCIFTPLETAEADIEV